jgi:AraC-like DNA-binding protein
VQFRAATAARVAPLFPQLAAADGLDRLALFLRILAAVAGAPARERAFISADAFALAVESRHQGAMRDAIRFVLANFRGEIRLGDVLAAARMSKPTFARQFKKHSGRTLGEFLQQVRLDAVGRELAETKRPVTEVALGCGFTQISFFNRLFRRARGCSPSEYRERRQRARRRSSVISPLTGPAPGET